MFRNGAKAALASTGADSDFALEYQVESSSNEQANKIVAVARRLKIVFIHIIVISS
jgi:hypothetical protein